MAAKAKRKMSNISLLHCFKFVFRSLMFIVALTLYIVNKATAKDTEKLFGEIGSNTVVLIVIWLIFAVEVGLRFFPTKFESMGCQKQFKRNYLEPQNIVTPEPEKMSWKKTFTVAFLWILGNAVFGGLYLLGIFDYGILILLFFAYSVGDMICVLFFCPFHTWIMKNKCCNTCRIYNWDFPMMFTPLIFIPHWFTWSLVAISLALLIEWEVLYKLHPERFTENTNHNLRCANCTERACAHKKQLAAYIRKWNTEHKSDFPIKTYINPKLRRKLPKKNGKVKVEQ